MLTTYLKIFLLLFIMLISPNSFSHVEVAVHHNHSEIDTIYSALIAIGLIIGLRLAKVSSRD